MIRIRKIVMLLIAASLLVVAAPVHADIIRPPYLDPLAPDLGWFGCFNITGNNPVNAAAGEAQLWLGVYDVTEVDGVLQAEFVLKNDNPTGPEVMMRINDIYFDDGTLEYLSDVDNNPFGWSQVVFFVYPGNNDNLPGGENLVPPFETTEHWTAQPGTPRPQRNAVGPHEAVGIVFEMTPGFTFDDLADALDTGALRIGIHVQGFSDGGSESFVCGGEPTAITLASFGAQASAGSITVAWQTGTEIDNAGFNLYRATSATGTWSKITSSVIAAQGNAVSGASYSFVDRPGYGTFFYKLEDVDLNGVSTLHGPVQATLASPFRRPLNRPMLPGS